MLRTPSRARSDKRNTFNVFKKGGKETELPKTAPTTPEDEDAGVTVMSREIDPTVLSTDVLEQIVGKQNPSSPSVGDHRSHSSRSGNHREEKKEDDDSPVEAQPPTPDDVVSKTLNYFDDMCRMPKVDELEESNPPKPYLLLNHIAGFDDLTTSPSLPSETTANESSAPYSRDTTTTASKLKRSSTAHNHENFEVVLDPSSVIKESSQKQNRGNRFLPFKKKTNDESNNAASPARDDEAELKESFDRLLNGTETLDKADRTRARQMRNKAGAVSNDEPKEENPTVLEDLNDILCGTGDDEKTEAEEKNVSAITEEDEKNIQALQEMVPVKQVVTKKGGRKTLGQRLKKIKNSAFMLGRKGSKSTKASGQTKADAAPAISPDEVTLNVDSNGAPLKPKQTWKSVADPNTGRTYYYHRKTRETTWVKPEALTRYEIAFQKWIEATAAFHAKQAAKEEKKVVDESKAEEKAAASESEPKEVASDPVEKKSDAKSAPAVEKTPAPVVKDTKKDIPAKPVETATSVQNNKQTINEMEPVQEDSPFDMAAPVPRSPPRFGRTMTHASKASARSSLTERTEKVRNTGKGRGSSFNPISENSSSYRVPSRVPVYRERQLVVEDLTESRLSAESYETSGGRRGRIVRGRARQIEPAPETYDGDMETDDYGASGYDNDTLGTDSVSALSENDTDFLSRKDNFDQARKRALDAAIESEDWDLAAALSDGMRANSTPKTYEKLNSSWDQSELDKFIANNDWTAVKNYIAKMRQQSKEDLAKAPPANKRIGSRSQMQHNSEYVSESSSSESSIDDATSASESEM